MTIIKLDTPLTRQSAKYEAIIAQKDDEIKELKLNASKIGGVNELLKFELMGLEKIANDMQDSIKSLLEHVIALRQGLPE